MKSAHLLPERREDKIKVMVLTVYSIETILF